MSDKRKEIDPGRKEGKKKLSDEELRRLVSTSLDTERSSRFVPVWLIRVISVIAGVAALLLFFLVFR